MKIHELRKKTQEELINLYKGQATEINMLRKEIKRTSIRWRDYYRNKEYHKKSKGGIK